MVTVIYLSQHVQCRPPPPRWDLAVINLYLKLRELIVLRSRRDSCFFWGQLILPQKSHCGYSPITARKLQSLYTFLFTLHLLSCMKEVQFMSLFGVSYQLHSFCSNLANRILKMPRQTPSRFWHVKYPLWKQLSTITAVLQPLLPEANLSSSMGYSWFHFSLIPKTEGWVNRCLWVSKGEQQVKLLVTWRRNQGPSVKHHRAEAPSLVEDKCFEELSLVFCVALLSKNTVHVPAQHPLMQNRLDTSQNRSWDYATSPGQKDICGLYKEKVAHHQLFPQKRWVKKCKASSSFENTEQLGSVTKSQWNKAKITFEACEQKA